MLPQGNDECNSYDEWYPLNTHFGQYAHTKLEFCFVFFMQRLVKGWCFSMQRLVPTSSSFVYLNVSLFFLFLIHHYVPFKKREGSLLVEFSFFFRRDSSSIVEPLFLL